MSRICDFCGKAPLAGHNVSHAANKTKRRFLPNLQRIRIKSGNETIRVKVCTKCIKNPRFQRV